MCEQLPSAATDWTPRVPHPSRSMREGGVFDFHRKPAHNRNILPIPFVHSDAAPIFLESETT